MALGISYSTDTQGNRHYTAFTNEMRYEISEWTIVNGKPVEDHLWNHNTRSGERNPLGVIPIIEYERSKDRMGVFEREIPEMGRLNLMLSDIGNDIDQECQQIWHANDVEFPHKKDADGNPTEEIENLSQMIG